MLVFFGIVVVVGDDGVGELVFDFIFFRVIMVNFWGIIIRRVMVFC